MPKETIDPSSIHHPFADLIGLKVIRSANGASECRLEVDQRLMNPHGVLHGGVLYSLADTGMGAALYTMLEQGESCSTIENKIVYLNAVRKGSLFCHTRLVQRTRTLAVLESDISCDGDQVAKVLGTFSIFPLRDIS